MTMTLTIAKAAKPLDALLARARRDSVEFPHLLANHVPMVLIALDRMGASPERLESWYATYRDAHRLPPVPPSVAPITPDTFEAALANRGREADWRAFFAGEVGRLGLPTAIRAYVPRLVGGVAASALHPLMRLAYAVLKGDEAEGAVALAYWATCYLPLPPAGRAAPDTDDPAEILAAVGGIQGIYDYRPETDLLWHNIRAVGDLPGFAPIVDRLTFTPETPRRMAATALAVFAATMDFSALHAVTGLHWVRLVTPHLDDAEPLYRAFWQVIAALVPKIGFPALPAPDSLDALRALPAPGWSEIFAAAIASDDEHDVSLVFSASQEESVWGDPLYRVVAARRVRLIA